MTTYALEVTTDDLGLGVISGGKVSVERRRGTSADQFPPVDVLYLIASSTDENGLASFSLKPDDGSTYHLCMIWDENGALVYKRLFSMPPDASNINDLPEALVGNSNIQFQGNGVDMGTPSTIRNVDFAGNAVESAVAGDKLTVTISTKVHVGADFPASTTAPAILFKFTGGELVDVIARES